MAETLRKKTSYANTISLQTDEMEKVWKMEYDEIIVESLVGKFLRRLLPQDYSPRAAKAFLREVKDQPGAPVYWVMTYR